MGLKTLSGLPMRTLGGAVAIATAAGFTPTPPPSGASAIDHAATLTQRNSLAAVHDIGGTSEASFTGFSDTTGWNTTTVTTAEELRLAIEGCGVDEELVITCNWNGASTASNVRANGIPAASLTANGSVDYGYNRPNQKILVQAGTGYTPALADIDGRCLRIRGANYIEFRGMEFQGDIDIWLEASYPTLSIEAYNLCRFGRAVYGWARTCHIEGCTFEPQVPASANARIWKKAQYSRYWNNYFTGVTKDQDPMPQFGFSAGFMTDWPVYHWVAGNLMYNCDYTTNASSGNHADAFQYSTSTDLNASYNILFEFNIISFNVCDSQAYFGDDASSYNSRVSNMVVHNNIIIMNAYEGLWLYDQSGNGECRAYRNTVVRGSKISVLVSNDTEPRLHTKNDSAGSGVLDVRENYAGVFLDVYAANTVAFNDNIAVNPRAGSGGPLPRTVFVCGGANWTTDSDGREVYDAPDDGVTDPATARAAIVAFWEPQAGWNDGTGCGPVNPANWPDRDTWKGALS